MENDYFSKLLNRQDTLPAEITLIHSILKKQICTFSSPEENKIRGLFLETLICDDKEFSTIPDKGLQIEGAYIVGDIDLCGCSVEKPIELMNCKVIGILDFSKSKISGLVLRGTYVEKLYLGDIKCSGSVILSYGFRTLQSISLRGAQIEGQLGCSGGVFQGYPVAISLESATIKEAFFWRHIKSLWGVVDLTNTTVGLLVDDRDSWPEKGKLRIAGFTYGGLGSNTNPSYFNRLEWLNRQHYDHLCEDFRPQPYEQLAKVLKDSGRHEVAKSIAIEKLSRQRNANFVRRNSRLVEYRYKKRSTKNIIQKIYYEMLEEKEKRISVEGAFIDLLALLRWVGSFLFGIIAGYGYRPFRVIFWSILIVLVGALMFQSQYNEGLLVSTSVENPSDFHSFAFALDTFIPLIDLREAKKWTLANTGAGTLQYRLIFYWSYILVGWILTAIFAASITGIIKK